MFDEPIYRWTVTGLILTGTAPFFSFYHVRTRRFDASNRQQVTNWRAYEWIDWYLKLSTLAVAVVSIHWQTAWLLPVHHSALLSIAGLALAGVAIALFAWAMSSLDAQYTPAHQSRLPSQIVRHGPYRFIRHPVYTSNLLLISSLFLFSGSAWLLINLGILIAYYVPTILVEERAIRSEFPEYDHYAGQTGRFFPTWRMRR